MTKKRTLAQLKKLLNSPIKIRIGVIHTKVVKDKTKYTRKKKHRKKDL